MNRQKNINSCRSLVSTRTVDTSTFSEMQQLAHDIVSNHLGNSHQNPLHLLIMGVAGTGKSYLIDAASCNSSFFKPCYMKDGTFVAELYNHSTRQRFHKKIS